MRPLVVVLALAGSGLGAACIPDAAPGPCSVDGTCLVGFQCVSGRCEACPSGRCGPERSGTLGAEGGRLCGPDDACLDLAADAIVGEERIHVRRPEPQPTVAGEVFVTRVYELRSETRGYPALLVPSTLHLPLVGVMGGGVVVVRLVGGVAIEVPTRVDGREAEATIDVLGVYGAVRRSVDGGAGDGGAGDGGPSDGG